MFLILLTASLAAPTTLHVGNSYTFANDLPSVTHRMMSHTLTERSGSDQVVTGQMVAKGGWRLSQHRDDMGLDGEPIRDLLGPQRRNDLVYLQEQSQIPGFERSSTHYQQSASAVLALHEAAAVTGAETLLLATWGRRNGDDRNPSIYPTFEAMNDRLESGTLAMVAAADQGERGLFVAPIGRAFAAVRQSEIDDGVDVLSPESLFGRLYEPDGSHPARAGTWLAGAVLVASSTGYLPSAEIDVFGLPSEDKVALVAAADHAVLSSPWTLPLPWVHPLGEVYLVKEGTYAVSGDWRRTYVWVQEPLSVDLVTLKGPDVDFALVESIFSAGQLIMTQSDLHVYGGLEHEVIMARGDVGSEVWVHGGSLTVQASEADLAYVVDAQASLELVSGQAASLNISGTARVGDGFQLKSLDGEPGATLLIGRDIAVEGVAHLRGTLDLSGVAPDAQSVLVLSAGTLNMDAEVIGLPDGWKLVVSGEQLSLQAEDFVDPDASRACGAVVGSAMWPMLFLPLMLRRRSRHGWEPAL